MGFSLRKIIRIGTGGTGAVQIGNITGNTAITGTLSISALATLNSVLVSGASTLTGLGTLNGGLSCNWNN